MPLTERRPQGPKRLATGPTTDCQPDPVQQSKGQAPVYSRGPLTPVQRTPLNIPLGPCATGTSYKGIHHLVPRTASLSVHATGPRTTQHQSFSINSWHPFNGRSTGPHTTQAQSFNNKQTNTSQRNHHPQPKAKPTAPAHRCYGVQHRVTPSCNRGAEVGYPED